MNSAQLIENYQHSTLRSTVSALIGLEAVPWASLHHAHGSAQDVPVLLITLCSRDPDHRQFALQLLHETIWHQGTIYEASSFVIPFLLKLVRAEIAPEPKLLIFLLTSLLVGTSDNARWVQNIHAAAKDASDVLCHYLDDPEIRSYVATALSFYSHAALELIPLLEQALAIEDDPFNRLNRK